MEKTFNLSRVCGVADEAIAHIASEFSKLAEKGCKQVRHNNIAKMIYWKLCGKWGCSKAEKWQIRQKNFLESEDCKILRGFPIQTDKTLENNGPNITVIHTIMEEMTTDRSHMPI